MVDGKFTAKERAYLASLPAVESVSASRIRYSDHFRVEAMCRYNAGESPSAIFREAGLDPKLIGYKRVERCIARWKQQERDERRKGKGAMNHYLQDVEDDLSIAELQGATHEGETNDPTEACSGATDHQQMRHAHRQASVAYRRAGTCAAEVHPVMDMRQQQRGREPSFEEAVDIADEVRQWRRERRKVIAMRVVAALLIILAIGIGGFPTFLQYQSARELRNTSDRSAQAVAGWPYPQADEAFAAAKAYNRRLAASGQPILGEAQDPFSQVQGSSQSSESGAAESGSGVMGTIRIPKISVRLPIYHGTSQSALASGSGHLYGSSLPVGGRSTHAVITGHRGLVEAMMFTRLDEMHVGDYFYIEVMGRTLGYKVDRISVIEPNDTSKLKIVPGEDRVTLMTCTPYGVNTHRLLVSAVRSAIPGVVPEEQNAAKDARLIAIAVSAGVLVSGMLLAWLRRRPWHIRRHAAWWPKRG